MAYKIIMVDRAEREIMPITECQQKRLQVNCQRRLNRDQMELALEDMGKPIGEEDYQLIHSGCGEVEW